MGNILIWFFTPRFGQNMLWLTGAANYLYPIASILLLLLPYRLSILDEFSEPKGKNIFGIGMFILGILGGAGIENASGAAVLSCVLFLFYIKFVQKKEIDTWMKMGLLGVVMGYMFLLLAPGNYARAALIQDNRNIIYILFERFVYATNMLKYSLGVWAVILFFVVLPIVLWQKNKKDSLIVCMYLVSALACNYAMVLSPTYPPRSFLGTTVFLSIGILYGIHIYINEKKNLVSLAIAFALLLLEFIPAIYDIYNINVKSNEREEYILREKENGNYDISLYPIASYNKYNAIYDLEDISEDTNHYINATISKYYGLEKVRKAE